MPRLTDSTPKYRRHKASGQAVVTIQGKDHYLGPHGTKASRLEYDRLIGEWLAAGRPAVAVAPAGEITISEVMLAFLKHAKTFYVKKGRPTRTAEGFKPIIALVRQFYGRTPANDFGPLALKSLQGKWVEQGKSRRTVNDYIHRVRQIFKWAASEQLITPLVWQALATVAGLRKGNSQAHDPAPIQPVADATVQATLPYLSPIVADMVRFQRLTGCRPGEVCILRPCDVDTSGEVWRYIPTEHKTEHHGKSRAIYIGPRAQDVLRPYLLREKETFCFSPAESERLRRVEMREKRKTRVQPSQRDRSKRKPERSPGDHYDTHSFGVAVRRAAIVAEVEPWTLNRLRHSAATEIRQKFGLEAAQVALGHSRADVTQLYAEKNQELAALVARQVG